MGAICDGNEIFGPHVALTRAMDRHKPASQGKPAVPSSDLDSLWQALMREFEDATQEVLARLHVHKVERSQEALDALIRAQLRRSKAVSKMLRVLDTLDGIGRRPP
jgi:hypothetical protein